MNDIYMYKAECSNPSYTSRFYTKPGPANSWITRHMKYTVKLSSYPTFAGIQFNLVKYKLVKV